MSSQLRVRASLVGRWVLFGLTLGTGWGGHAQITEPSDPLLHPEELILCKKQVETGVYIYGWIDGKWQALRKDVAADEIPDCDQAFDGEGHPIG